MDSARKAEAAKDSVMQAFGTLWEQNEMNSATLEEKNELIKLLLGPWNKICSDGRTQRKEPATD